MPLELLVGIAPDPGPGTAPDVTPPAAVDIAVLLAPLVSGLDEDADVVAAEELLVVVISTGDAAPPAGDDTSVMLLLLLLLLTGPCMKSLLAKRGHTSFFSSFYL